MGKIFWICLCSLIGYQTAAVTDDYDSAALDRDLGYDFDTEQSQARYDSRLLSEALQNRHTPSQKRSTPCYSANTKYEHGQKVMRKDPCEMCLCVDGEIFCWWKTCVEHRKWKKDSQKARRQKYFHSGKRQTLKKSSDKYKMIKFIPKKVLSFPQHLPSMLHFDFNSNETVSEYSSSDSMDSRKTQPQTERQPFIPENIYGDETVDRNLDQTLEERQDKNKIKHSRPVEGSLRSNFYRDGGLINGSGDSVVNENEINYPDNDLQKGEHSSGNHNIIGTGTNLEDLDYNRRRELAENQEAGKIQFADVPLAKHYIITSSGSIENTDILASENVLSQFRNEFKVVSPLPLSEGHSSAKGSRKNAAIESNETGRSSRSRASSKATEGHLDPSNSPDTTPSQSASTSRRTQLNADSTEATDIRPEPTSRMQGECVVMGVSYKVGTVLPQETGNCLQCICIDGANENDAPRVTCSPHNCPPLVLPDLFDTTGY